ncbi:MAG TPA: helix-hairpin-helix domain-containing protein [Firmicutes bacterium]|nr:helix-hairpin-helix domain-containing protein [Bacillota bacterium]
MTARQRVIVFALVAMILIGNGIDLFVSRQKAVRFLAAADAAGPPASAQLRESNDLNEITDSTGAEELDELSAGSAAPADGEIPIAVTKALNPDGTEHDLEECKLIHINWAVSKELQQLPGIGSVLAERIIEKRREKFFLKFEDLLTVSGIGQKRLERIKPFICLAVPHVEQ